MRLLVALAWDGTDWHGAAEVSELPTVGGALRAALARVGAPDVGIDPLSRTDAGVHARDGLFVVDGLPERPVDGWWRALVHHLPDTVRPARVARIEAVPQVVRKIYRYTLDASEAGDPRWARFAWRIRVPWEGLEAAAAVVKGPVDYEAFRRRDEGRRDLRRRVDRCGWHRRGDRWVCEVVGDGFPLRGVRSLVGAMVYVARGHAAPTDLRSALAGQPHPLARQQAPAKGLCLDHTALEPPPRWWPAAGISGGAKGGEEA